MKNIRLSIIFLFVLNSYLLAQISLGDSFSTAVLITGSATQINVGLSDGYCKFVAGSSTTYSIYSSLAPCDPIAYLYNSNQDPLTYDDDGGGSLNFLINYSLTSGATYYLKIKCFDRSDAVITLNITGGTLPVELISFSASVNEEKVLINWKTATEVNNYGFEVERTSTSLGTTWEKIGLVQGHGNSNSPKSYSFTDMPNGGTEFKYRLKQIDFDGKFEYSPEVKVNLEVPAIFSVKQNFPNPFNPSTNIEFAIPKDNNVEIKVFNVLGMEIATLLNEHRQAGMYSIEFNASNLSSGIYFYKIVSGKYSEIKKMILLR